MSCDPVLAAMLARPWNNNACRGYVIYAMENCGFSPTDIRRVVAELHEVFDFCGLEEAQQHFENGARQEGGTAEVPPFCVSPRDKGNCRSLFLAAPKGGPHGSSRTNQGGIHLSSRKNPIYCHARLQGQRRVYA